MKTHPDEQNNLPSGCVLCTVNVNVTKIFAEKYS